SRRRGGSVGAAFHHTTAVEPDAVEGRKCPSAGSGNVQERCPRSGVPGVVKVRLVRPCIDVACRAHLCGDGARHARGGLHDQGVGPVGVERSVDHLVGAVDDYWILGCVAAGQDRAINNRRRGARVDQIIDTTVAIREEDLIRYRVVHRGRRNCVDGDTPNDGWGATVEYVAELV